MDARLIVLGVSILIIASGFIIYGLLTNDSQLAGSSLSAAILGLVFMSIGLTYRDPLGEIMKTYSSILSSALVKSFEDLGYISGGVLFTCIKTGKILIVFSKKLIPCNDIKPGFGIANQTPYLSLLAESPVFEEGDLESMLMRTGLAQVAMFSHSNNKYIVELHGLRTDIIGEEKKPLNPYQIIVPLYVTAFIKKNMIIEDDEIGVDYYRAVMKVIRD